MTLVAALSPVSDSRILEVVIEVMTNIVLEIPEQKWQTIAAECTRTGF